MGYLYSFFRCTSSSAIGDAQCNTGYDLVTQSAVGGSTYIAASTCTFTCGGISTVAASLTVRIVDSL